RMTLVQIVDQNRIFENGQWGLTLHLALDPASGDGERLKRFRRSPEFPLFKDMTQDGVPCYVLPLGSDLTQALKVTRSVLENVYGSAAAASLECEVYDEAASESAESLRGQLLVASSALLDPN